MFATIKMQKAEKACVLQVSMSKGAQDAFRQYGHAHYSAVKVTPLYAVVVREKAFTETQHRAHINRVFKHLNIRPTRRRRWLQVIAEKEALGVINPVSNDENDRDTKIIVLAHT